MTRLSTGAMVAAVLILAASAFAGPQHWGFGFPYLAAVEEQDGVRRLVVFEPPLHARDCTWPVRFMDRATPWTEVAGGAIAIGDYWPGSFAREYLTTVEVAGGNLTIRVYEPPEYFSVRQWPLKSTSAPLPLSGTLLGATAGNPRNQPKDQLIVALQDGADLRLAILTPPSSPTATNWTKLETVLTGVAGSFVGMACGDFWNENKDHLVLATQVGGQTQLAFYTWNPGPNVFSLVTTDAATDLPVLQADGLTAADYEKDGFDVLTLVAPDGTFHLRVAPAKPGQAYNPGPEYTGKSWSGQWLPGNGGTASLLVMSGSLGTSADSRLAFGAGRVFGYINTDLNTRYPVSGGLDAQIAFCHRSPTKDQCPPYGWPATGQTVTYDINLNNNGATAVPAGAVRLKVWYNRPNRNADTDPTTCDAPDFDQVIADTLPAYNAAAPVYVARTISFAWPYGLEPAGPGATWQRVNLGAVGERWVIAVLEYDGDVNLRNNRYEMAVHGLTFHPIFRTQSSLADRQPTVQGDPASKEYLARKLADAVQSMWERSRCKDGSEVPQRLWFDSYEIGWPSEAANPNQAWQLVQSKYEGWRELDGWWGVYQGWERFNWGDGGAELHETGHLFHPIGDLYQYYVSPVFTGTASMDNGTPVQVRTWMWPADSFGEGQTRITWPACDEMRRHLLGVRNAGIEQWWTLKSDRTFVRVVDRNGAPVAGAEVKVWGDRTNAPAGAGVTDANGRWETTALHGAATYTDAFGLTHYNSSPLNGYQIYTVRIGDDYHECRVIGTEEDGGHSQYAKFGHAMIEPDAWTWDFNTNYDPAAPAPDFDLTAAVQGSTVNLGVVGPAGAAYRVYRKWEPAHLRTYVGEFTAGGTLLIIPQNMASADSYGANRFRATYEVTQLTSGGESLPRMVQVTGISNARGLTARSDGKLLLAANAGIANPFCQVLDGTTPYQELFYHFRFGHTATKVVESQLVPGKYYATLAASDMSPDYRFDLVPPRTQAPYGYDVRNEIGNFSAKAYSAGAPYTIQLYSTADAAKFCPGDQVQASGTATVTAVQGDTLTVSAFIFGAGGSNFSGTRLAGKPGSNAEQRNLANARGLATVTANGAEYVYIADTGNRRLVLWDANTRYVAHRDWLDITYKPAAVAAHPTAPAKAFVLVRRGSSASQLDLVAFDGEALASEPGYPVTLAVGDATDVTELGLAVAVNPLTQNLLALVTDARLNRVCEYELAAGAWQLVQTYTQATGNYAGAANLNRPVDVAYITRGNALQRYAVETTRVVRLDPDADGDGIGDDFDNCPAVYNPGQEDTDQDGLGDACDALNDCNGNGIADDADIAGGTSRDCNGNGRPDDCDIAFGASADADFNGIPDECQTGPTVASLLATGLTSVAVVFSVPVEETSAESISNYALDQGVTVQSATLAADSVTVTLTTTTMVLGRQYRLTVNNVTDLADPPQAIAPNSQFLFTVGPWERVTDDLVLLYDFEEGAGTIVYDVSGFGTPLNLAIEQPASVAWTPGGLLVAQPTRIYSATGSTKVTTACKAANEMTIEAWVAPTLAAQAGPARLLTSSNSALARDFMLAHGGTGAADVYEARIRHSEGDINGLPALVSPAGTADAALQHVLCTRDPAGNALLYVDGTAVATEVLGGTFANWHTGYRFTLANEYSGGFPWLGEFQLVAIYARALTPTEVLQNYLAGPEEGPAILPGDLNCDGAVSFNDINPFVLRLSNPAAYASAYPDCPDGNGDLNGNGSVGFEDINPFVALLAGGQ